MFCVSTSLLWIHTATSLIVYDEQNQCKKSTSNMRACDTSVCNNKKWRSNILFATFGLFMKLDPIDVNGTNGHIRSFLFWKWVLVDKILQSCSRFWKGPPKSTSRI